MSTPEKTQSKQGDLNYFSPIPFTEYLKPIPWQSLITSARIGIFFHHCGKHSPIAVEEGFTFRTGGFTMLTPLFYRVGESAGFGSLVCVGFPPTHPGHPLPLS